MTAPGLLSLPAELRLMIWELCLLSPTGYIEPVETDGTFNINFSKISRHQNYEKRRTFSLLVTSKEPIQSIPGKWEIDQLKAFIQKAPEWEFIPPPSLLGTCHSIRAETEDLFWGKNTFSFYFCRDAANLLGAIKDEAVARMEKFHIKSIIHLDILDNYPAAFYLRGFLNIFRTRGLHKNLRRLEIEVRAPGLSECMVRDRFAPLPASPGTDGLVLENIEIKGNKAKLRLVTVLA